MKSRRHALENVRPIDSTHAGLWLDGFLAAQTGENSDDDAKTAKSKIVREVGKTIKDPEGYRHAFDRWYASFGDSPPGTVRRLIPVSSLGRVVIGLGQKGVIETGITLSRTWGLPFLPGSSLKGVAAAAAHQLVADDAWRKEVVDKDDAANSTSLGDSAAALFGTTENAGKVTFHDALYVPGSGGGEPSRALHADVMTVHHAQYYQADGSAERRAPDGTESPNPVSFLAAHGEFVIVLESTVADMAWLDAAEKLLMLGLEHLGIGSKTNAGYGRLTPSDDKSAMKRLEAKRAQAEKRVATAALAEHAFDGGDVDAQFKLLLDEFLPLSGLVRTRGKDLYDIAQNLIKEEEDSDTSPDVYARFVERSGYASRFPAASERDTAGALNAFKTALADHPKFGPWLRGQDDSLVANIGSSKRKALLKWAEGSSSEAQQEADGNRLRITDELSIDLDSISEPLRDAFSSIRSGDESKPFDVNAILSLGDTLIEAHMSDSVAKATFLEILDAWKSADRKAVKKRKKQFSEFQKKLKA